MIVGIPYMFDVVAIPRSAKKSDIFRFVETVDVQVDEIGLREATAACTWSDPHSGTRSVTWLHGNGHVAPGGDPRLEPGRAARRGLAETVASLTGGGKPACLAIMDWERSPERSRHSVGSIELREALWSDRAARREEALRLATRFIAVDGELWHPVDEPTIQIELPSDLSRIDSFGAAMRVSCVAEDVWKDEPTPWTRPTFRADRHEDAMDYALERFGEALQPCAAPSIIVPASIRFDDEAWTMAGTAREVARRAHALLQQMPVDGVVAWAALRDAARTGSVEDQKGRLENMLPWLEGSALAEEAADALRRWTLRPFEQAEPAPQP